MRLLRSKITINIVYFAEQYYVFFYLFYSLVFFLPLLSTNISYSTEIIPIFVPKLHTFSTIIFD